MRIVCSHTTPQFEKDFVDLPIGIKKLASRKIKLFENNCFHPGLDTHKLKGILKNFWSFSINNDYRVVFRFLPRNEAIYYKIGLHKIYKELGRSI